MPPDLTTLLRAIGLSVAAVTRALREARIDVEEWAAEMRGLLARGHLAGAMLGSGGTALSPALRRAVGEALGVQFQFLGRFVAEIADAAEFRPGWEARAAMYAESVKTPYWVARTRMLPLPALPGDGSSQCLTRCRCSWVINQLDGDGNWDCYWTMGAKEHCQTCRERADLWAPLRIRGGELQL